MALGIEKITLLGVSYGTRVAGEYARRFPDRTAALILDSPVALDAIEADGLDGIAAMPRVLREVCAAGPCATTVDDAAAALNAAVRRVRRGDVRGPQVVSRKGRRATVDMINIGELRVYNAVQFASALGPIRSALPAALQSLARGDAAPLIHLSNLDLDRARPDDLPDEIDLPFSASRFHATMCLEAALPWRTDSALDTRQAAEDAYVKALGPKPFAPFSVETVRGAGTAIRCSNWPATPAPEPPPATTPDVPVLVLSGREDLVTPVEQAREVAATYPRATLLEIPHVGHSVMNDSACARAAAATFIAGTTPEPCAGDPQHPAAAYAPGTLRGKRAVAQATIDGVRRHLEASREHVRPAHALRAVGAARRLHARPARELRPARRRVGAAGPGERALERHRERPADAVRRHPRRGARAPLRRDPLITPLALPPHRNRRPTAASKGGMNKLVATLLSLTALAAIPATANAQSSTTVRITNQNSKALSVVNGSVVQAPFTNRADQKWAMTSLGNVGGSKVAFTYRSLSTGRCLDIEGPGSGRAIVLRPCSTTKRSQHWVRDFAQNTTFLATVNRSTGLAMSVKNRSRITGAAIVQEFNSGGTHQKWSVFGFGS